jgi:hypothetical protein
MVKKATFLPALPLRAKTRLVPGKAAASKEAKRIYSYPPAPSLPRQALFPWPYVEPLSDARTKLAAFSNILLD